MSARKRQLHAGATFTLPRATRIAGALFVVLLIILALALLRRCLSQSDVRAPRGIAELENRIALAREQESYSQMIDALEFALQLVGQHGIDNLPAPLSRALVEILTTVPPVVTAGHVSLAPEHVFVSPDRRLLVVVEEASRTSTVGVVPLDGSSPEFAYEFAGALLNVRFSSDSKRAALYFDRRVMLISLVRKEAPVILECNEFGLLGCPVVLLDENRVLSVNSSTDREAVARVDSLTGSTSAEVTFPGTPRALDVSPSSELFAVCTDEALFVGATESLAIAKRECSDCGRKLPRSNIVHLRESNLVTVSCGESICVFGAAPDDASDSAVFCIDLPPHHDWRSIHALASGDFLIASTEGIGMRVGDTHNGPAIRTKAIPRPDISQVPRMPQFNSKALGFAHHSTSVFDATSGEESNIVYPFGAAAWTPGGDEFVVVAQTEILSVQVHAVEPVVRQLKPGDKLPGLSQVESEQVSGARPFATSDEVWATLTPSGDVILRAFPFGTIVAVFPKPFGTEPATSIRFSPDGRYLLGSGPNGVTVWTAHSTGWVRRARDLLSLDGSEPDGAPSAAQ